MKYKYSSFLPPKNQQKWIKRPVVEVEIFGTNGSQKFNALIDSGADCSLFNAEIAELVGIDLSKSENRPFVGIGGKQQIKTQFLDNVEIKVEGISKSIKIPVGFINSDSVGLLLGQDGFFDSYKLKFEKDHDSFEIMPISK